MGGRGGGVEKGKNGEKCYTALSFLFLLLPLLLLILPLLLLLLLNLLLFHLLLLLPSLVPLLNLMDIFKSQIKKKY